MNLYATTETIQTKNFGSKNKIGYIFSEKRNKVNESTIEVIKHPVTVTFYVGLRIGMFNDWSSAKYIEMNYDTSNESLEKILESYHSYKKRPHVIISELFIK